MDEACDVTCLENKRKCKQRFAFTVAMTSREYTLLTIFTLLKIHLVSFSFGGEGWGGVNEVQYGLCENGELQKIPHTLFSYKSLF